MLSLSAIINRIKTNSDYRRLFENFTSLSVLQVLNYILPLITFPYLVRVLGVEKFGLLAFATATIGYFQIITDYGFNLSATREIAIHRDNREKVQEIFSAVMTIKFGLTILSLILLTILVFSFEKLRQDWEIYYLTFGMVVGNTLFPIWFFQGMERMKYITFLNILAKGLFAVSIFVFVKERSDYWKVPLLNGVGFVVAGLLSLLIITNHYQIYFKKINLKIIRHYLKNGAYLFSSNIFINIYTNSTSFFLGIFTNNIILGYYSVAEKIATAVNSLFAPISQSIFPFVMRKFFLSRERAYFFIKRLLYMTFILVSLFLFVLFIFSEKIINVISGSDYKQSIPVFNVLLIWVLLSRIGEILGSLCMIAQGQYHLFNKILMYGAVMHIVLFIIFSQYLNELNAAILMVISYFLLIILFLFNTNLLKIKK